MIEMASIMIGVAGVAQQLKTANAGGGSSAPTSVSIATSSSGNYNNAVLVDETAVGFALMEFDGSGFSSNEDETDVDLTEMDQAFSGISGQATLRVKGYIRATGATSFQWGLDVDPSTSLTYGSAGTQGTASTSQDATSSGITKVGTLVFGGGRGGILYPADGDELAFKVSATATNSNGSTTASSVIFRFNFTN